MSEEAKALRTIKDLLILFVILFAIWCGVFTGATVSFLKEVRAFNTCSNVDDLYFTDCYEQAKR